MSDAVGAPSDADAPPARQLWLKDRVGSWPEHTPNNAGCKMRYEYCTCQVFDIDSESLTHVDP